MKTITGNTFHLAAPFWRESAGRKTGWLLAAALVLLVVASTSLNVWLNNLNKAFYDALQNLNAPAF